jgi:hypothetical protein
VLGKSKQRRGNERTHHAVVMLGVLHLGLMQLHLLVLDPGHDFGVLATDDLKQVVRVPFRTSHLAFIWATGGDVRRRSTSSTACHKRNMDVHGFRVFQAGILVDEARADTLDLHTRARLLLNVLDERTLRRRQKKVVQSDVCDPPEDQRPWHGR